MNAIKSVVMGFICLAVGLAGAVGVPTKCATLSVKGYSSDVELMNFPVLVRLSASRLVGFSYADCQEGGTDISFRLPDGTLLDHEIDTWNPDGESLVWVRLPVLNKNASFVLFYGDPQAKAYRSCQTDGSVWTPAGYVGVWHMNEAEGSVRNSADPTRSAVPTPSDTAATPAAEGVLGGAREANSGAVGYFLTPSLSGTGLDSDFTCSAWVNVRTAELDQKLFSTKANGSNNGWFVNVRSSTEIRVFGSSNNSANSANLSDLTKAGWLHQYFQFDGATMRHYQDKNAVGAGSIVKVTQTANGFAIGGTTDGKAAGSQSAFDEVRLRKGGNGTEFYEWVTAEYDTVHDSGFIVCEGGAADIPSDRLTVDTTDGVRFGTPDPAYGPHDGVADGETTCTAEARVEFDDGAWLAACAGWQVFGADGQVSASGVGASATFVKDGAATLMWSYVVSNRLVLAGKACTIDRQTGYWLKGSSVTLTATPADPTAEFLGWTGDVPEGADALSPVIEVTMDRPRSLRAGFSRKVYVSASGSDAEGTGDEESPYRTIQTAIDAADDGDTVFVGEGTYGFASNGDYWVANVSNAVKVIATGAREKTIIDCTKTGSLTNDQKNHRGGFYLTSEGAMISGFTVTNAYALAKTWGPLCGATAGVVTNCYIHAPQSWLGASLGLSGTARGSEIEMAPCKYSCSYFDGLYLVDLNNTAVLDRLKLVGATITYAQGNAFVRVMGNGVLRNSLIANNAVDIPSSASQGKFIQVDSNGRIESCTIADNTTGGGNGLVYVNSNTAVITNTVVWGNKCNAGCLSEIYGSSGSGYGLNRFFCSCAAQLTDDVRGNLSSDPQFTDAANGDYEPKITSRVLDIAGAPDWAVVDAVGNARIVGEGMDLGAVECRTDKSKVPLSCTISKDVDKGSAPLVVTYTANLAGNQDGIEFSWTFSDGTTSTDGPSVRHEFKEPGAHTASVAVRNGKGETDSDVSDVVLALPKTCYVSTSGKNIAPYLNWENAATSVDAAVDLGTEEVVVGPGDYTLSAAECVVKAATFVHSSEGPEVTTIRANSTFGDRRAFSVINDQAVISGFTLTGGHAANFGYASGLNVSAGVVSNCIVKGIANTSRSSVCHFSGTGKMVDCVLDGRGCTDGNQDGDRGLIYLTGQSRAERCVVSGFSFSGANAHPHAAVLLNGADTVLRNSLIYGCTNSTALKSGANFIYGGGIVIRTGGGTVENCTVTANYATTDMGCGIAIEGTNGKVVNTISWGNGRKPAEGALNPQIYTQNADLAAVCSYSCAPELTTGVRNVTDDPKIRIGNHRRFQLYGNSPCVNAGDNSVVPSGDVDLLHFGRIYNVNVDMGCFESQSGGLRLLVR